MHTSLRVPRPPRSLGAARALPLALALVLAATVAPPAAAEPSSSTTRPSVTGAVRVGQTLQGHRGAWTPAPESYEYQWLRGGREIPGATRLRRHVTPGDRGRRLALRVTAVSGDGEEIRARSAPTARIKPGLVRVTRRPSVAGVPRWTRTLTVRVGAYAPRQHRVSVRWLRDGRGIPGAGGRRFRPRPRDVGHRIRARVTVRKAGFATRSVRTRPRTVGYRVPVRRRVSYHVETRGRITTSLATFRRQAQETFAHAQGWRNGGTRFRRVARGGGFTLVLAAASWVPRFSGACSSSWSCRVGRYVIINQTRWKHATRSWNRAGGSLRGYRHMVVNHEVGHWLGRGHAGCPGRGRLAPVMMQQSKDLRGCRFNPFPTRGEL